MYKITALLLVLLPFNSFGQDVLTPEHEVALKPEHAKSLLNQCSRSTPKNISDSWAVSDSEISQIHEHFNKLKSLKSSGCCIEGLKLNSLDAYAFQYLGVTIKKRRYIYVNAFFVDPEYFEEWYKEWEIKPMVFCDGGESFWGVLFDLERSKFEQLNINGI